MVITTKCPLQLTVQADEYLDKLVEFSIIKFYAIMTVVETQQVWAGEDDFQVIKPPLKISIKPTLPLGLSARVEFHMKNPLKTELSNCKFAFQGPQLCKHTTVSYRNIKPEESVSHEMYFTPMFSGRHKLVATFDSKEISDFTGSINVEVTEE